MLFSSSPVVSLITPIAVSTLLVILTIPKAVYMKKLSCLWLTIKIITVIFNWIG